METARDELLQLLRGTPAQQDVKLAPAILRLAFSYCAEHFTPPSLAALNRVDILTMLADVVSALRRGEQLFATEAHAALEHAVAGERLQHALRERATALARQAHELETVRAALAPLVQQEATLRAQAAECERLTQQRAELERLVRLTQHMDILPRQVEELTRRLAQCKPELTANLQQEHHIEGNAKALVVLSTEILADLEPRARHALREAERLEAARAAAAQQLQEAQARAARVEADLQKLHSELQPHLAADRAVAHVLPKDQPPHALLDQAERLLQQAEAALQAALKTRAETQQIPRLPLMEGRHAPAA